MQALNPTLPALLAAPLPLGPLQLGQPMLDMSALLIENALLKNQVAQLTQQLAAANAAAAAARAAAARATTGGAAGPAAAAAEGKKKRKKQQQDPEYSADDGEQQEAEGSGSDSEYEPEAGRRRGSGGGGSGGGLDRATAAAARAQAAADKQAQKDARKRSTEFLRTAGSHMSDGMAWRRRGCAFSFSAAIDPAAFECLFGGRGTHSSSGRKVSLDAGSAQAVFGKGRCVKKYRLGSVGQITGVEVKYDAGLQKATCACTWSIDKMLGW